MVIQVTSTGGDKEDQPHFVYDHKDDRYFVVYRSAGTNVLGVEISVSGAVSTDVLSLASDADDRANPRVCYNETDKEFLCVFERFASFSEDPSWDIEAARVPAADGLSEDSITTFGLNSSSIVDEREPDVLYDVFWQNYVVAFIQNPDEGPGGTDTKFDILVGQVHRFGSRFRDLTQLYAASATSDERRPRLAYNPRLASDPGLGEYLVVWEKRGANTDLMSRRYSAVSNGS